MSGWRPVRWPEVDWSGVRRITVVPYGGDVGGWVLARVDGRLVLPTGEVLPGEDPQLDTTLRLPLAVAGFRRQAWYPFAVDGDHLAMWSHGGRYRGQRAHADPEWWSGPATEAERLLRDQGSGWAAELVAWAERCRSGLTDEEFYAANRWVLEPSYLRATTPQEGSGFRGSDEEWRAARSILCDALAGDGSFCDVGCANGYLMECVVGWAAERGIRVEPYGMDLSAALVAAARRRLPRWADRIWVGNALEWVPPAGLRFDVVHTLLDCVPDDARRTMLEHLLAVAVADDGRLLVSSYADVEAERGHAAVMLRDLGFEVAGQTRPAVRPSGRVAAPSAWIAKGRR